jgi:hypothetical protein
MKICNDQKGFHHFYLGITLLLIGFLLIWKSIILSVLITILGIVITTDDLYQHYRIRIQPDYTSPLHNLYILFLKSIPNSISVFIIKINNWFDTILNKSE